MLAAIFVFAIVVLVFAVALCGANDDSYENVNRCVMCGAVIPEGTQYCKVCERKINDGK